MDNQNFNNPPNDQQNLSNKNTSIQDINEYIQRSKGDCNLRNTGGTKTMFYKIGTINENKLQKRTHWKVRS